MKPVKQLKLFLRTLDRKHLNCFHVYSICPLNPKDVSRGCWGCSWLSDNPNDYLEYDCVRFSMTCASEVLLDKRRSQFSTQELHIAAMELYARLRDDPPRRVPTND